MPQQPPSSPSPYGFITNPTPPPKRHILGGGSSKSRIAVVAAGAVIFIIIAILIMTVFSLLSSRGSDQLKSVYAQQQELIYITEIGSKEGLSPDIRGFAATALLSTLSSQQEVKGLLGLKGIKLNANDTKPKGSKDIESILTSAAANNRYDEAVRELIESQIINYNQALKRAQETNSGQKAQEVLSNALAAGSVLNGN